MTFTDYRYYFEFKDRQDRTHRVELYPDAYSAGTQTELTGAPQPLTYTFGSSGDHPFRPINPTDVAIRVVVQDEDLFDALRVTEEGEYGVIWTIAGQEVWRGYIIPDELHQSYVFPSELEIPAVCGLVFLENTFWTPASNDRAPLIELAADALGDISGTSYQITAAADWHSSAGSGNSFAEYEMDPTVFRDTEARRLSTAESWATSATVLSQIAGRFAGKLFMADGRWRLIQREEVTGANYQADIYDSSGTDTAANQSVARVTVGTDEGHPTVEMSVVRKYKDAEVKYSHGPLGSKLFSNGSFEFWTGSTLDNWTEHDEEGAGGDAPDSGSIYSKVTSVYEASTGDGSTRGGRPRIENHAVKIGVVSSGGSLENVGAKALVGIYQDADATVTTSQGCVVGASAQIPTTISNQAQVARNHPYFAGLWLDDGAGTEYYYDGNEFSNTYGTWVSATMSSPPTASKIKFFNPVGPFGVLPGRSRFLIDADRNGTVTFPAAGTLRLILYNVVDQGGSTTPTGVIYDNLNVTITGGDDSERGTRVGTSSIDDATYGATYDGGTFFIGQGPTEAHRGRLTRNSGSYASSWSSSGGAEAAYLSDLHADRVVKALGNSPRKLSLAWTKGSGTYWPYQALLYDSVEYTCVHVVYDARDDHYSGTWVATGVTVGATTTGGTALDGYVLPQGPFEFTLMYEFEDDVPPKGDERPRRLLSGAGTSLSGAGTTIDAGEANTLAEAIAALDGVGGTVRIPEGTYTITSPISVPSNVTIEGAGWGTIIDVNTDDDSYGFYLQKGAEGSRAAPSVSNVTIRGLTLQGRNDTAYFHEHTHLLNINGASDVLIEDVQFLNWRGDAVYLGSGNIGYTTFTADAGTDVCTTPSAHNLSDGDEVVVWSTQGEYMNDSGASGDEDLPGGLESKKAYFVRDKTSTTFKLAATSGGAAINITGAGTGTHYVGLERHNEQITIRNCHFDGGATDKEHKGVQTAISCTATASTDLITMTGNSYADGYAIRFAGATGAGLTDGTTYYVRDRAADNFKVAATSGGAAINLTGDVSSGMSVPADVVNNRQGISVVDGRQIIIDGNYFTNCTAASMPGAIDIEPDRAPYHIINGIRITNNQVYDTGGNIGAISCNLQRWGDFYTEPSDILIQGNTVDTCDPSGIVVQKSQKDVGGQSITAVDAGANTVTCADHGYVNTVPVWFKGTTVPNGLTEGTTYYVRDRATNTFKLALTPGGSVISLSATTPSCTVHDAPGERSIRQNVRIINNRVTQATGETTAQRGAPFVLHGTNGAVVTGNQFSYCKGAAFVGYVRAMSTRISDNSFVQVGTSEGDADLGNGGLQIIDASILHITNNEFTECGMSDDTTGEMVYWNGGNVEDVIVTGNIITGVTRMNNVSIAVSPDFSRGTHIWRNNIAKNISGTPTTTFGDQWGTLTVDSTTPDVLARELWQCAQTGATSITNFLLGYVGQRIYVRLDTHTTLVHNTGGAGDIRNASGANITGDANHIICYVNVNGNVWVQAGIDT